MANPRTCSACNQDFEEAMGMALLVCPHCRKPLTDDARADQDDGWDIHPARRKRPAKTELGVAKDYVLSAVGHDSVPTMQIEKLKPEGDKALEVKVYDEADGAPVASESNPAPSSPPPPTISDTAEAASTVKTPNLPAATVPAIAPPTIPNIAPPTIPSLALPQSANTLNFPNLDDPDAMAVVTGKPATPKLPPALPPPAFGPSQPASSQSAPPPVPSPPQSGPHQVPSPPQSAPPPVPSPPQSAPPPVQPVPGPPQSAPPPVQPVPGPPQSAPPPVQPVPGPPQGQQLGAPPMQKPLPSPSPSWQQRNDRSNYLVIAMYAFAAIAVVAAIVRLLR